MGRWLIFAGIGLITLGVVLQFAPWLLKWFGRLPGDINIQSDRVRIFIPLTSMVLVSLLLTVVIHVIRRFLRP